MFDGKRRKSKWSLSSVLWRKKSLQLWRTCIQNNSNWRSASCRELIKSIITLQKQIELVWWLQKIVWLKVSVELNNLLVILSRNNFIYHYSLRSSEVFGYGLVGFNVRFELLLIEVEFLKRNRKKRKTNLKLYFIITFDFYDLSIRVI